MIICKDIFLEKIFYSLRGVVFEKLGAPDGIEQRSHPLCAPN